MPNPSYKSGYLVELKAREELKKQGATYVVRSSRSLTPVDLIAIFPDRKQIWLVQCKAKQKAPKDLGKLSKHFENLRNLRGLYTVIPYVYMKQNGKYQFIEV
jgi:hypothetical protein